MLLMCREMIRSGMRVEFIIFCFFICDLYFCGLELFLFVGIVVVCI